MKRPDTLMIDFKEVVNLQSPLSGLELSNAGKLCDKLMDSPGYSAEQKKYFQLLRLRLQFMHEVIPFIDKMKLRSTQAIKEEGLYDVSVRLNDAYGVTAKTKELLYRLEQKNPKTWSDRNSSENLKEIVTSLKEELNLSTFSQEEQEIVLLRMLQAICQGEGAIFFRLGAILTEFLLTLNGGSRLAAAADNHTEFVLKKEGDFLVVYTRYEEHITKQSELPKSDLTKYAVERNEDGEVTLLKSRTEGVPIFERNGVTSARHEIGEIKTQLIFDLNQIIQNSEFSYQAMRSTMQATFTCAETIEYIMPALEGQRGVEFNESGDVLKCTLKPVSAEEIGELSLMGKERKEQEDAENLVIWKRDNPIDFSIAIRFLEVGASLEAMTDDLEINERFKTLLAFISPRYDESFFNTHHFDSLSFEYHAGPLKIKQRSDKKYKQEYLKFATQHLKAMIRAPNYIFKIGNAEQSFCYRTGGELSTDVSLVTNKIDIFFDSLPEKFKRQEFKVKHWIMRKYYENFSAGLDIRRKLLSEEDEFSFITRAPKYVLSYNAEEDKICVLEEMVGDFHYFSLPRNEYSCRDLAASFSSDLNHVSYLFFEGNTLVESQDVNLKFDFLGVDPEFQALIKERLTKIFTTPPQQIIDTLTDPIVKAAAIKDLAVGREPLNDLAFEFFGDLSKRERDFIREGKVFSLAHAVKTELTNYLTGKNSSSFRDIFNRNKNTRHISKERRQRANLALAFAEGCIKQFTEGTLTEADVQAYVSAFYDIKEQHAKDRSIFSGSNRLGDALAHALPNKEELLQDLKINIPQKPKFSCAGSVAVAQKLSERSEVVGIRKLHYKENFALNYRYHGAAVDNDVRPTAYEKIAAAPILYGEEFVNEFGAEFCRDMDKITSSNSSEEVGALSTKVRLKLDTLVGVCKELGIPQQKIAAYDGFLKNREAHKSEILNVVAEQQTVPLRTSPAISDKVQAISDSKRASTTSTSSDSESSRPTTPKARNTDLFKGLGGEVKEEKCEIEPAPLTLTA